jgi:hypothetical protein
MMKGNNLAAGLRHSEEFRKKISIRHKGIPLTLAHRMKIGAANKGRPYYSHPVKYHHSEEVKLTQSAKRKAWFANPDNRERFKKIMKNANADPGFRLKQRIAKLGKRYSPEVNKRKGLPGRRNPRFGKTLPHRKSIHCRSKKGEWMRSTWEKALADWLYDRGIEYQYEAHRVPLSEDETYLPDFYIPSINYYVEVKGWWDTKSKHRVAMFLQSHDNLIIVDRKEQIKYFKGENYGNTVPRGIERLTSLQSNKGWEDRPEIGLHTDSAHRLGENLTGTSNHCAGREKGSVTAANPTNL